MTAFVMEAKENYDPTRATQADGGAFPVPIVVEPSYIGLGYDPVSRNLFYQAIIGHNNTGLNDSGYTLWDGADYTLNGAHIGNNWSFRLARKNIDTGVVTFFDAYDPAFTVPAGIGPGGGPVSDGTWRRNVKDTRYSAGNYPCWSDPRTQDVWFRAESCELFVVRAANNYALAISPLVASLSATFNLLVKGMTDDWVYAVEVSPEVDGGGKLHMTPRIDTAAEVTADKKLAYASFDLPAFFSQEFNQYFVSALHVSENLFVFGSPVGSPTSSGTTDFRLFKFTKPSTFVYPTPPIDGGFTEVTPWTSTTGPNAPLVGATLVDYVTERCFAQMSHGKTQLQLLSVGSANDFASYDDNNTTITHTWYKPADGTWGSTLIAHGYMKADFTLGTDNADSAFILTGEVHAFNTGLDKDTAYDDALHAQRWYAFFAWAIDAGVPDFGPQIVVFVRLDWNDGAAPTIGMVIDERNAWDPAYAAYAAAIGSTRIVASSLQLGNSGFVNIGPDMGVFDPQAPAFWFSGMDLGPSPGNKFFQFDPAFTGRTAVAGGTGSCAQPPLLKLSFTGFAPDVRVSVSTRIGPR